MHCNEWFYYDVESVRVTKVKYSYTEYLIKDWTFDLCLVKYICKDNDIIGYLFTLDNDKLIFTELNAWIDGELINEG